MPLNAMHIAPANAATRGRAASQAKPARTASITLPGSVARRSIRDPDRTQTELRELGGIGRRGSGEHEVGPRLRLRERLHFTTARLAPEGCPAANVPIAQSPGVSWP